MSATFVGELQRLADAFAREIDARTLVATDTLTATYATVRTRLLRQLDALIGEMDSRLKAGAALTPGQVTRVARVMALLRQADEELLDWYRQASAVVTDGQRQAVDAALRNASELLRGALAPAPFAATGVTATFTALPAEALQELVGVLQDGTPVRQLLEEYGRQSAAAIREEMLVGLASGVNPREVARRIRAAMDGNAVRALTVARTELLRAYRESSLRLYRANRDLVTGWVWWSSRTERTCFPAGVAVSGPAPVASTARHYTGELVVLSIAGCEDLAVTPNHPILTPQGWVAAGQIKAGDDVLRCADSERTAAAIGKDDYQVPASIEDVANSFGMVSMEVPATAPDFHGDGVGSDVYTVRTHRLLQCRHDTTFVEPCRKDDFSFRDVNALTSGSGLLAASRFSDTDIKRCLPVALAVRPKDSPFPERTPFGSQQLGLRQATEGDSRTTERGSDSGSRDPEIVSECFRGFTSAVTARDFLIGQAKFGMTSYTGFGSCQGTCQPGLTEQPSGLQLAREALGTYAEARSHALRTLAGNVRADRILHVARRGFSGHVYNLQTAPHWYLANGVIVANCAVCWAMHATKHALDEMFGSHPNCRCTPLPQTKTWREMGFGDVPGDKRLDVEPGEKAFKRLTAGQQRRILGPAKYRAYSQGTLTLPELVKVTHDARWGITRTERSFRDSVAQRRSAGGATPVAPGVRRGDPRLLGTVGEVGARLLEGRSRAREVYVAEAVIEHYRKHGGQFDLEQAERMISNTLARPRFVVQGRKPRTMVFIARFDADYLLVLPVKALPDELWLETLYIDREAKFFRRRWVREGWLYGQEEQK